MAPLKSPLNRCIFHLLIYDYFQLLWRFKSLVLIQSSASSKPDYLIHNFLNFQLLDYLLICLNTQD